MQRQARHRLAALLLRNDIRYVGKTAWTAAHRRWIARLTLPQPAQRIAFEEYVQTVSEATERVQRLTAIHRTGACARGAGGRWSARCRLVAAFNSSMPCASWPSWGICRALAIRAS